MARFNALYTLNPLMYTLAATVKLGPLDKDFKYSDILINKRLKKKVIYDFKNNTTSYE